MRKFYLGVISNFRYAAAFWLLAHFLWLLFMFYMGSYMNKMEFMEYVWMLRYDNAAGIAIYTGFVAMCVAIFFRFTEIVKVANLKEYALRVNDLKKIKRSSLKATLVVIFLYTILLVLVSSCFTFFLKSGDVHWFKIFLTALLYCLFFSCISMFNYMTSGNLGYFLFILLHTNNVFSFLPWFSVPYILLNGNIVGIFITAGIYGLSCILIYVFGSKRN